MAVMTYTHRQVLDMIPEYLTARVRTFDPAAEALAKENGISRGALGTLSGVLTVGDGDRVERARISWRSPYAVKRPALEQGWAEIVSSGLAEAVDGGWRVRPPGIELAKELSRRIRAHVRALEVPAGAVRRAAGELGRIAARVPASAERAARAARVRSEAGEPASDLVSLSLAAQVLWSFRDDCHVAAWQAKGYEGPAFEVLSYVWSSPPDVSFTKIGGHRTIDDLEKALKPRQDRADIEGNVDALVRRGDLARDGAAVSITPQGQRTRDAVEDDTDRRFFAIWDLDDDAVARLGDDLRSIIDALPKA